MRGPLRGLPWLLGVVLCLGLARGAAQEAGAGGEVDPPVRAAARFLLAQIGRSGQCAGEPNDKDPRFGGKTALCVQALLTAGIEPDRSVPLARAIVALRGAKLHGTYAVAGRACAWALLDDPNSRELLRKDTAWLIEAMNDRGGYTYTSSGGLASEIEDNSNAQMAVRGVAAGARAGVEVPRAYWNRVEKHFVSDQQSDGGWGYRVNPRTLTARTYGSMTAAGLASLLLCYNHLRGDQFIRCEAGEYQPVDKALAWLGEHFRADENPRKGVEWYYYWLFCAARVGLTSGNKYFAAHDWYAAGRRALLARQRPDGSFGYGDRVAETAFAVMFLVRGRYPILLNKLRYAGRWNPRPRDAANLARWVSTTFERPVGWQIVTLDSPPTDWHEAPILYLSGAGPVQLTKPQIDKVRTYVHQGGLLLTEAACNNAEFTLDVGRLSKKLFPDYPLIRLGEPHAIYSAHFPNRAGAWLSGVSNGVRLLAVHAPKELSLAMQLGPRKTNLPLYELLANVYMHTTDRGQLRPRAQTYWPVAAKTPPRATIRVARLRHGGNCDPEPLAWQRLALRTENRNGVRVDVSKPLDIAKLDARKHRIAHMTGTNAFDLSPAETAALRTFFRNGGTLLVDAAGGSRIFSDTVAKRVYPLVPGGKPGELARDHPMLLKGPYEIKEARYRRDYARTLVGEERTRPRLRVVLQGPRLAIIHSREDLTFGLLGCPAFKVVGYTPETAERLVVNILFHVAKVPSK